MHLEILQEFQLNTNSLANEHHECKLLNDIQLKNINY